MDSQDENHAIFSCSKSYLFAKAIGFDESLMLTGLTCNISNLFKKGFTDLFMRTLKIPFDERNFTQITEIMA